MKSSSVLKQLGSDEKTGLTEKEAEKRLLRHGPNELKEKRRNVSLKIFSRQFTNLMFWVLFAAAVTSYFIGEVLSFWAISFIMAFIVILGFAQEFKAERAMIALKKIVKTTTKVVRDKRVRNIITKDIVPGDILLLETGDKVPADLKILNHIGLKVDEASLTGESEPVRKSREDLLFASTNIVQGKCTAVVFSTGMDTEIGKIAEMIQEEKEVTPLQRKVSWLAKLLAAVALTVCILIFMTGMVKGAPLASMLVVALALAVAAVPEGLPLTLTVTLSLGMHRMARSNAVIRRMAAVETLGSTTVVCTDKTGTMTKNEMTVERLFVNDTTVGVTGVGYKPEGEFIISEQQIDPKKDRTTSTMLKAAALCNNAYLFKGEKDWETVGDPTEIALIVMAAKAGEWKDSLEERNKRIEELIFTSERRMMSCVYESGKIKHVFAKGAPETILERCKYIEKNGKRQKMTKKEKDVIMKMNDKFAGDALRVLGFAYKKIVSSLTPENIERDLVFLGLTGMIDPPREEMKDAISTCRGAGIRPVMITGDNQHTAKAIAKQIGMLEDEKQKIITGTELDEMKESEFDKIVEEITIYARTRPEHKMRIIKALQKKGHIVAMTGDGINDAPAVKKANIGVAMGIKGTEVTKESADMVLADDNFATIMEAVKGGRTIYGNIRKFTTYLISRNFTEVILIFIGIAFFNFELLPLLGLQILFINSFDEVMPAMALGNEPARKGTMMRKPRDPKEGFLTRRNTTMIITLAALMALTALTIFMISDPFTDITRARTMVFATIVSMVMFIPFSFRALEESVHKIGLFNNKWMLPATVTVALTTILVMYTPITQAALKIVPLSLGDWSICLAAAFAMFIFMEAEKFLLNRKWSRPELPVIPKQAPPAEETKIQK
ncbi:MAG: cation-translocating P-type ATPase [Candidatus Aenigmatarchaeota archaeon]|nr:MAG: cation-translocating P-type ATPase [Candidatus Aenigmarchaeota archaeon]